MSSGLDLSRFFLVLFSVYAWVLLLLFRLTAGRVVGVIRREFAAPHFVMVVGTGERAVRMARGLEQSSEYGIRLRGFLSETRRCSVGDPPARALQGAAGERSAIHPAAARGRRDHLRRGQREPGGTGRSVPAVRRRGRAHARGGGFLPARQQHGLAGPVWRDAAADVLRRAVRRNPAAAEARHGYRDRRGRAGGAVAGHGCWWRC